QMPRRAVELRLEAGMHVVFRPASPLLAARHELQLHHALRAEVDLDRTVEALAPERNDDAEAFLQSRFDFGSEDDLRKVRRAAFLFAFADEDEIHRELLICRLERVQCGETGDLRSLLVRGAASDDHLADAALVDEARLERRRAPLGGIELLDVVHEIEADRVPRARAADGEDPRLAFRLDDVGPPDACIAKPPLPVLAALRL